MKAREFTAIAGQNDMIGYLVRWMLSMKQGFMYPRMYR